jgi:hypothetical protein
LGALRLPPPCWKRFALSSAARAIFSRFSAAASADSAGGGALRPLLPQQPIVCFVLKRGPPTRVF